MHRDGAPTASAPTLLAVVLLVTVALVALIAMAPVAAMPAMAARFAAGGNGRLFAQMVMVAPSLALMVAAPILGWIADRIGRKSVLLVSLGLYVIGGAGVMLADDRTSVIALRLVLGVAAGGLWPISLALIGEHFEHHQRERLLGFASASIAFAVAGTVLLAGVAVDRFGWRAPFAFYLLALPILIACWFIIPPSAGRKSEKATGQRRRIGDLIPIIPYLLVLMLFVMGVTTPYSQVGFVLQERGIASATIQGMIISTAPLLSGIAGVVYGYARRYVTVYQLLAISGLLLGTGIIAIAFAPSAWVVLLGCAVVGFGGGLFEPSCVSRILTLAPLRVHAVAMGLNVCAINLGQSVNPIVIEDLRNSVGLTSAFVVLATSLIIVGLFLASRRGDKRPATVVANGSGP
jgi:MFS family permease